MDPRTELLKTTAVQACLGAMGEPRVYGDASFQWAGVILTHDNAMSAVTHWTDETGQMWRYAVDLKIEVRRERIERG